MTQYGDRCTAEGMRLAIYWPEGGVTGAEARRALSEGDPRIMVGSGRDGALTIDPQTMQPGEEWLVADRLLETIAGGS